MEITLVALLIHISLSSFTKCHSIIQNNNITKLFTKKVPRLNHKTLQYSRRNTNIAMMFIKSPSNRAQNQLKWKKKKDQLEFTPTHTAQTVIENALEFQEMDTSIGTTDILELSEFKPQWFGSPNRTFSNEDYTISTKNILHYKTSIPTPEVLTEYFLEAWPTFTSIRSSIIQSEVIPTSSMRYYRTLFEATTKNGLHSFYKNHILSRTTPWRDFSKRRKYKIPKDKFMNVDRRKQNDGPDYSDYDYDSIGSSTRMQYYPSLISPSSPPTYDDQLQNYISSTENPNKKVVKNIARTGVHDEKKLISKCFSCGWHQRDIPHIEGCHNSFDAAEPLLKGKQVFFKSHCYNGTKKLLRSDEFLDNMIYEIDVQNNITFLSDPFDDRSRRSIMRNGNETIEIIPIAPNLKKHHRKYRYQYSPNYIGGCFKRFTDVGSQVYYEKGCRAWPPIRGKSFASRRFAKVERMLRGKKEGCVSSPMASLTPFSRGVYLWVRYHVCICQGHYCNAQGRLMPTPLDYVLFYIVIVYIVVS